MFKNMVSRFAGSRLMRSASYLAGAAVIGQLLMLAAMPVLTRLYSPSEFGIFAGFSAAMGVILVTSSLRFEMAIPLMRNIRSARSMLVSALVLNAVAAVVSLGVVLVWGKDFARLLDAPGLATYLLMIPLAVLGAGSYRALNLWVLRNNAFVVAAQTKLVQSVTNVFVQLAAGFAGLGAIGLIVGHILGFTVGLLHLARGVAFNRFLVRSRAHRRRSIVLLKGHGNFARFDVPASLVDMLGLQLPNLALLALFGPVVAGTYFLAERMLTAPMAIVSQALAQTILAKARETNQQQQMITQTARVTLALAALLIIPVVVIAVGGEYLFSTIFDESWRQAGIYAAWLIPGFAMQFIYSSISTTLMATNGQKTNLLIHSTLLIFKTTALAVGYKLQDPLSCIIALSIANVVGGFFSIGIVFIHLARRVSRDNQSE